MIPSWAGRFWRWCCPDPVTGLRRALYVAFGWFVGAQFLAALLGGPSDFPLSPTISLVELVWTTCALIAACTVLPNLRDALADWRRVCRAAPRDEVLHERARAWVRNEGQRAWTTVVLVIVGLRALTLPQSFAVGGAPATIAGVLLVLNLFISVAPWKAYCSVVDRIERKRELGRQLLPRTARTRKEDGAGAHG